MSIAYPHIAERVFGRAHPIEPDAFRAIVDGPLARRVFAGEGEVASKKGREPRGPSVRDLRRERMLAMANGEWQRCAGDVGEYFLTHEGVAVVPVCGVLSQRFDWLSALCGWATYEGLGATFDAMAADGRVRAVLMDVESPGGEAAGMLDIADKIMAARERFPVWAVANAYAFSAAYAVAGSASRLLVPRLCQVGSIGAVAVHVDQSGYDKQAGLKYTAIFSGARKIDGWNHAPLSDAARGAMQERIDYCRDQFAALVGRQGRMSAAAATATEANVYHDQMAVDAGLADGVMSFEQALAELSDHAAGRPRSVMAAADSKVADTKEAISMAAKETTGQEVAGKDVESAAAAAVAAAVPAEPVAATAAAKSQKCAKCGHEWDDEDDGKDKDNASTATAAGVDASTAILDLCAAQGASATVARGFIHAKTPLAEVRAKLAADKARASDSQSIDPTQAPAPAQSSASMWDRVVSKLPGARTK